MIQDVSLNSIDKSTGVHYANGTYLRALERLRTIWGSLLLKRELK
jgi:hypothetical protein